MTHRQFLAWHEWLGMQMSVPSRADWYSMQCAAAWGGGDVNEYKIKFEPKEPPDLTKLTKRELRFYTDCGNDLAAWKTKTDRVHQNALAAAIGAKHERN